MLDAVFAQATISTDPVTYWTGVVSAAATAIAAIAAWRSALTSKQQAKLLASQLRLSFGADVICYLRMSCRDAPWPELVIENAGKSSAFQIQLSGSLNFLERLLGEQLAKQICEKQLSVLPPGMKIVYEAPENHVKGKSVPAGSHDIRITYKSDSGSMTNVCRQMPLSVDQFWGAGLELNSDPLRLIATNLKRIESEIEGFGRVCAGR